MVDNITSSYSNRSLLPNYNPTPTSSSSQQHHGNYNQNIYHEGSNIRNSNEHDDHEHEDQALGTIKEQDRLLPIANVGRIMKHILPANAKISKEAKETMQECVSEFISFVTGEASDKCHKEKRKTVNGDDICWALSSLGFDEYADPLKRYLHRYREFEGERVANQNKERENIHG
ncbi:nuclear transcription factor Y subunit B-5-like [Chenopodium quinoa]|uniref:Transcription factor CBF/NF-Y/archaeal histone domain-containing protein n=1 Tax=Chenopodium quinoa TaxID=63459 RepID=A0A803MPI7_CHEQI|nr:nuclear transcription factor Y subunit B-5-like [Chenopodium quinoa]